MSACRGICVCIGRTENAEGSVVATPRCAAMKVSIVKGLFRITLLELLRFLVIPKYSVLKIAKHL